MPAPLDGPTVATTAAWSDGPTVVIPHDTIADLAAPGPDEEPADSTPLDELVPGVPVWRPPTPAPPASRGPAYYVLLGAAVVVVVAVVAAAVFVGVARPGREVAGTAAAARTVPAISESPSAPSAPAPSTPAPSTSVAEHPLSASAARMGDATCALPRFDVADERQAAFYAAAKTCADNAWRGVLAEAGLQASVPVVVVTKPVQTASCGEFTPDSPSAQCDGTVYMTPAHLRDGEKNGRYPGRYFGVFLREYARALQYTTGLAALTADVEGGDKLLAQQATCLAGIASGAMADRGAVDANITGEISDRLSGVDAPPDAKAWLDKGFQARTLDACNTWA